MTLRIKELEEDVKNIKMMEEKVKFLEEDKLQSEKVWE